MLNIEESEIFEGGTPADISRAWSDMTVVHQSGNSVIARAKRDGRWWTLKAIPPTKQDVALYTFLQQKEYDILRQLSHPHIVKVHSLEWVKGLGSCIVMEWVDGTDLAQWLETKPTQAQKQKVLDQLLDTLTYVHSRQVVHRDLKPTNVIITRNGDNVKLIDFGVADADSYSELKQPSGTTGYISPEQLRESETDCRNDIWSLGCLMEDMKLGRFYRSIIDRCKAAPDVRYKDSMEVKQAIAAKRRKRRWMVSSIVALVMALIGFIVYEVQEINGRPRYDVVAEFRVANLKFTSWGGLVSSVTLAKEEEYFIQVPDSVEYKGLYYRVTELGMNSFKNDKRLQRIVLPSTEYNLLKGGFKGCDNLREMYILSDRVPGIGSEHWPATIDDVFDAHHYVDVTLYVPEALIQAYRQSPTWGRFRHIEIIKKP